MDCNNYSLTTADRTTHIKVIIVALIAGIAVVGGAIASRAPFDMSTQLEARASILKADRPVIWTSSDQVTIR